MNTKFLFLIITPLVLSACSLSLSPEKGATTTASPQDIYQESVESTPSSIQTDQTSPTVTPDPLDNQDLSDQELMDILDDIDSDLDLDSDFEELDEQLN